MDSAQGQDMSPKKRPGDVVEVQTEAKRTKIPDDDEDVTIVHVLHPQYSSQQGPTPQQNRRFHPSAEIVDLEDSSHNIAPRATRNHHTNTGNPTRNYTPRVLDNRTIRLPNVTRSQGSRLANGTTNNTRVTRSHRNTQGNLNDVTILGGTPVHSTRVIDLTQEEDSYMDYDEYEEEEEEEESTDDTFSSTSYQTGLLHFYYDDEDEEDFFSDLSDEEDYMEMFPPVIRSTGLTTERMDRLPEMPFNKASDTEACSICLEDFVENERVISLPCCHKYHKPCVTRWLKDNSTCPTCRIDVSKS